ncbi:hypothetical protein Droror1_Dr00005761 [Drosera rotundifolia]
MCFRDKQPSPPILLTTSPLHANSHRYPHLDFATGRALLTKAVAVLLKRNATTHLRTRWEGNGSAGNCAIADAVEDGFSSCVGTTGQALEKAARMGELHREGGVWQCVMDWFGWSTDRLVFDGGEIGVAPRSRWVVLGLDVARELEFGFGRSPRLGVSSLSSVKWFLIYSRRGFCLLLADL